jgi:hypothetical protein
VQHSHKRQDCTIRVLVADNSRFHTQLLVGVLSRDPDLHVISSDLDAGSLVAALAPSWTRMRNAASEF